MSEGRQSFRMEPKGRVPRTAKLLVGSERAPVDCQVINLSAGGACLKLHTMLQLPKRFEFLHGTTHNVSQLVWQRGYLVGIRYEATADKSLRGYRPSGEVAKQSSLSRRRVWNHDA
jgi:PilZ domain